MKEIIRILKGSSAIFLGTVDRSGKPHVRPFALALERNGVLYFSTSNETSAYKDLQENPYIEISIMDSDSTWIRVAANIAFTSDIDIKKEIITEKELLKSLFQSPENPSFKVFYLTNGTATIYDYSGNPPQTYQF